MILSAFDLVLCAGLLALAFGAVTSADLLRAVVMFIAFGMLMALTWARLGSADLALAEAAVGAGFTGVLLLAACGLVPNDARSTGTNGRAGGGGHPRRRLLLLVLCLSAGAGLAWIMVRQLPAPGRMAAAVRAGVDTHVLNNPVTAVLLDFRGYDTLLELVVLMLALLGLRLLMAAQPLDDPWPARPLDIPLLGPLLGMQVPVLSLFALYLFYIGSQAPGGAFQAGALLGALGVLLRLTGRLAAAPGLQPLMRIAVIAGLAVFSGLAWLSLAWEPYPLAYPVRGGYVLFILVEFAIMISTAVTLVLLFSASPGLTRGGRR